MGHCCAKFHFDFTSQLSLSEDTNLRPGEFKKNEKKLSHSSCRININRQIVRIENDLSVRKYALTANWVTTGQNWWIVSELGYFRWAIVRTCDAETFLTSNWVSTLFGWQPNLVFYLKLKNCTTPLRQEKHFHSIRVHNDFHILGTLTSMIYAWYRLPERLLIGTMIEKFERNDVHQG